MNKKEIRHFKLTSGEEVICEVVEWDSEDSSSIIIRAAMLLVENISIKSGVKIIPIRAACADKRLWGVGLADGGEFARVFK